MSDLGTCSRPGCNRPATARLEGTDFDGAAVDVGAVCERHLRDMTAPCCVAGCDLIGLEKAPGTGGRADGSTEPIELRFCREHYRLIWAGAATVTLKNGDRMIHDGQGRLKSLPRTIRRG